MKVLVTIPQNGMVGELVEVLGPNSYMTACDGVESYTIQCDRVVHPSMDGLYVARVTEITLLPVWPRVAVYGDDPCACDEEPPDDHYGAALVAKRSHPFYQGLA
jgi:hypothetical protein